MQKKWPIRGFEEICSVLGDDSDNSFKCLNHGDAWVNNYMFKYDEYGNPIDVLFLDFQVTFWNSPIVDLLYFFITSTNNELRANDFDKLIKFYHQNLSENLIRLGYTKTIPTLKQLHIDILQKGFYSSFCMVGTLGIVLANPGGDASLDLAESIKNEEVSVKIKREIYNNERYLSTLEILLPLFDLRGMLDI